MSEMIDNSYMYFELKKCATIEHKSLGRIAENNLSQSKRMNNFLSMLPNDGHSLNAWLTLHNISFNNVKYSVSTIQYHVVRKSTDQSNNQSSSELILLEW